jgi:hypothetical protein
MKMMFTVLVALILFGVTVAQAGYGGRYGRQDRRIDHGVCRGSLTRAESRILHSEQRNIARAWDRALADGVLSAREARHLEKQQDKASRRIARLKHNRWVY